MIAALNIEFVQDMGMKVVKPKDGFQDGKGGDRLHLYECPCYFQRLIRTYRSYEILLNHLALLRIQVFYILAHRLSKPKS